MYEQVFNFLSEKLDFLEEIIPMGWNLEVVRISNFYKKVDDLSVSLYEKGDGRVFLTLTFKDGSYACLSLLGDNNYEKSLLGCGVEEEALKGGGG